jgi:hypothetical protein
VPTRYRELPGCPRSRPLGNNLASAKSQTATLNEQFNVWQLQRVKQQLGISKPAGFCPASDETKVAQTFQIAGVKPFPNGPENLAENKAVSVKNSAR